MLDVKMVQGNSLKLKFKLTDANGSPIDLNTYDISEILWVAKELPASTTAVIEKRYSVGEILVEDSSEGQIVVLLVATDTQALVGNYFHEVMIQTVEGDTYTVVEDSDMDIADFIIRQSLTI